MSSLAPYLMDSPEEARRLELKTDPTTALAQLRWAGLRPGLRVGDLDAPASEGLGPPGRQESEGSDMGLPLGVHEAGPDDRPSARLSPVRPLRSASRLAVRGWARGAYDRGR